MRLSITITDELAQSSPHIYTHPSTTPTETLVAIERLEVAGDVVADILRSIADRLEDGAARTESEVA